MGPFRQIQFCRPDYVFVYGTLRAGEINDINRAAERHGIAKPACIGAAYVRGRLFDFGSYPGLVLDDQAAPVRGDVYEIEDALVPVLDEIEEVYPGVEGLFRAHRLHVQVALEDAHTDIDCLIYPVAESAVNGLTRIEGGDWVEHRISRG
ncbi:gamma-glutamylcyclotransferase family protein [Candidatus Burkholderia verschuerenii]|uniref:gamma-glutamylcyclotransferase family protein n=1 Tax=Candidatus Burkholderia verschuerenii TaxID=242163 RepID=UPI001E3B5F93|nr:gamma-glutamylcyclotransferase family protein [Candidatus Burkholderia verschuerenii]